VVDGGDQQRCGDVCRVELRGQWHRIYLGIGEPLSAVVAGAEFAAVGGVDVKTEGVAMIRTL